MSGPNHHIASETTVRKHTNAYIVSRSGNNNSDILHLPHPELDDTPACIKTRSTDIAWRRVDTACFPDTWGRICLDCRGHYYPGPRSHLAPRATGGAD